MPPHSQLADDRHIEELGHHRSIFYWIFPNSHAYALLYVLVSLSLNQTTLMPTWYSAIFSLNRSVSVDGRIFCTSSYRWNICQESVTCARGGGNCIQRLFPHANTTAAGIRPAPAPKICLPIHLTAFASGLAARLAQLYARGVRVCCLIYATGSRVPLRYDDYFPKVTVKRARACRSTTALPP